jgi:hypothetical protein
MIRPRDKNFPQASLGHLLEALFHPSPQKVKVKARI